MSKPKPMMSLIEKMARAYDAEDAASRGEVDPWSIEGDDFEEFRRDRIAFMKVAIGVLQEPESIVRLAEEAKDYVCGFSAMIDAAMEEAGI